MIKRRLYPCDGAAWRILSLVTAFITMLYCKIYTEDFERMTTALQVFKCPLHAGISCLSHPEAQILKGASEYSLFVSSSL